MLLPSETEWGFPAFWKAGRGCSASGWRDKVPKHFNECSLGQWWQSQFLNLELSEHLFPLERYLLEIMCVIDLSFHMHRSQNNAANTAILSPGLCKWDWAELLFPACPFSADPWRFPKKVPQSSSTFCCSSDIQLLSVFSLRRVSGIFQALSDNHVVLLIQKSSTPCSRGVNSGPRKLLQDWKEK